MKQDYLHNMQQKMVLFLGFICCVQLSLFAQTDTVQTEISQKDVLPIDVPQLSIRPKVKAFSHLDLALSAGVTGLGFDLAAPLNDFLGLRAGFSVMPRFDVDLEFRVVVGQDEKESYSKLNKLSNILEQITGYPVRKNVIMESSPNAYAGKLLLDIYPFHNKHWRFTTGFFIGNSTIAKSVNSAEDMTSLVAVGTYNKTFDKLYYGEPFLKIAGKPDIYLEFLEERYDDIMKLGRMGLYVGEYAYDQPYVGPRGETTDIYGNPLVHKAGTPYMMEPGADGMVRANVKVNTIRPYVGFGYEGALAKRNPRFKVGFDCGMMFWGGTPHIILHDGIDMSEDLVNVRGLVGKYVDAITFFKVCPVFDLKISYRLF